MLMQVLEDRLALRANNLEEERPDFLSIFADAVLDGSWSKQEALGEVVTVFFGGYETMSNATSVLLHHLAEHRDKQDKLKAELRRVLGCTGVPTYEQLTATTLPYTFACINESMRLLPVGPMFSRDLTKVSGQLFCALRPLHTCAARHRTLK